MSRAGSHRALVRLARLIFDRHAAALADVDVRIRTVERALWELDTGHPDAGDYVGLAGLAAVYRWDDWRRHERVSLQRKLAALRAERDPLAQEARRAFGRWQVLQTADEPSS